MFMLVKYSGNRGIALPELIFWRQFVPVVVLLAYLAANSGLQRLHTQRLASHGRRSMTGMVGMVTNFTSAMLLPLAVSTTLGFTAPLFAVLLAATVMKEHVGLWRWSAVVLGFAGVVVIAQPGTGPISALGALSALIAAFVVAAVSYQIRDLGRTEEPIRVVFYFSAFGALISAPFLPFYTCTHSPFDWALLIATGLSGLMGQLLLTASLRFGVVSSVLVMDYTSLIWATLYGWLIWDHVPAWTTWLGAPLIVAAGLVVLWRERRLAHRLPPVTAADGD